MRIHYKRHFKKNQKKNLSTCNSIEKETIDSIHDKDCFENNNYFINNNMFIINNYNFKEWNEMMKEFANDGDLNHFQFDKIDNERGEKIDDMNFYMLLSSELNPMKLS